MCEEKQKICEEMREQMCKDVQEMDHELNIRGIRMSWK